MKSSIDTLQGLLTPEQNATAIRESVASGIMMGVFTNPAFNLMQVPRHVGILSIAAYVETDKFLGAAQGKLGKKTAEFKHGELQNLLETQGVPSLDIATYVDSVARFAETGEVSYRKNETPEQVSLPGASKKGWN